MTRSQMMSGIGAKNTAPELIIRRGLHAQGIRFRLHRKDLPGKPDLVLSRFNAVIFVHGCFWHAHAGCRYFKIPNTRSEFWTKKLKGNQERDATTAVKLQNAGWRVLTVWECATRSIPSELLIKRVLQWLHSTNVTAEIDASSE